MENKIQTSQKWQNIKKQENKLPRNRKINSICKIAEQILSQQEFQRYKAELNYQLQLNKALPEFLVGQVFFHGIKQVNWNNKNSKYPSFKKADKYLPIWMLTVANSIYLHKLQFLLPQLCKKLNLKLTQVEISIDKTIPTRAAAKNIIAGIRSAKSYSDKEAERIIIDYCNADPKEQKQSIDYLTINKPTYKSLEFRKSKSFSDYCAFKMIKKYNPDIKIKTQASNKTNKKSDDYIKNIFLNYLPNSVIETLNNNTQSTNSIKQQKTRKISKLNNLSHPIYKYRKTTIDSHKNANNLSQDEVDNIFENFMKKR